MKHPAAKTRHAFTLIELILVLAIIGILMAVAAPSLARLRDYNRLDSAGRDMLSMLIQARSRAISEGTPYRLVIDTDRREYWLEQMTGSGFQRPAASWAQIQTLNKQLELDSDYAQTQGLQVMIRVEPDGTNQVAQLILTDDDGDELAIYCLSPAEPYQLGKPRLATELTGGVDVDTQ